MTKEEYIKTCGANSSKDLSDDQIISFFIAGHGGKINKLSAMVVKGDAFALTF